MRIAFATHLSVAYNGGGEKWIINTAKALAKKYDVEIYALPFLLDGKRKIDPKEHLEGVPYHEGFHHNIKADVTYCMYNPLSFLNFNIKGPKIAGLHSETYWHDPNLRYGKYPLLANIANRFTSYFELRRFNAVHRLNNLYPVNHPSVYTIPDYVDSEFYRPHKKSDEFTVAFASRQVWQKGFDVFNNVANQLDCRINVSGNIPEEEMPEFLSDAHVVLVPSRVDTFGLTCVESNLCETPVVTSPLASHFVLGLPLRYASTIKDYVHEVNSIKEFPSIETLRGMCRQSALQYDRNHVMNKLEAMFCKVANAY
jgi:glycosyltransferase involved in cell wall biosynthesis